MTARPVALRQPTKTVPVDVPWAPNAPACAFPVAFFPTSGPNSSAGGDPTPFGTTPVGDPYIDYVGLSVERSQSWGFDPRGFGLVNGGREVCIAVARPSPMVLVGGFGDYLPTTYHLVVKRIDYSDLGNAYAGSNHDVNETYTLESGELSGGLHEPTSSAFWSPGPISPCAFDNDGNMYQWVISDIEILVQQGLFFQAANLIHPPTIKLQRYELVGDTYEVAAVLAELTPTPFYTPSHAQTRFNGGYLVPYWDPALALWALSWNPYDGLLYTMPCGPWDAGFFPDPDTDVQSEFTTLHSVDPQAGGLTSVASVPTMYAFRFSLLSQSPPQQGTLAQQFTFTADGSVWYNTYYSPYLNRYIIRVKDGAVTSGRGYYAVNFGTTDDAAAPLAMDRGADAMDSIVVQEYDGSGFGITIVIWGEIRAGSMDSPGFVQTCQGSLNYHDSPFPWVQRVATAIPGWRPSYRDFNSPVGLTIWGDFTYDGHGDYRDIGLYLWRMENEPVFVHPQLSDHHVRAPDPRPVVIRRRGLQR